ncbi:MAG: hypothetical protein QNK22_02745 [Xanthomonadales bacterium]|nr:hypothetical protein [Xanthomonadales bacterium]
MKADQLVALKHHGRVEIVSPNRPALRQRLEAKREGFVRQGQTQQALDSIELFLRRQENA